MKPWRETYPGACSSRQTVGGRVLRRAVREGRPRFLWGGSSPVWCRYSHATYTKESHHSPPPPVHLINREPSLSPGRGKEESDGVSAPPQLHSLAPCSADCSVLHLCPSRLLCCGPRRSAKQTHSPAIWAKQQPRLQSVVVQQQEGNTGRAAAAAGAGGTTAADRYCRLQGDCCISCAASISSASSYGCLCLPRDIPVSTRICCQNSIFSTEKSAKSAKGELKYSKYASWTT